MPLSILQFLSPSSSLPKAEIKTPLLNYMFLCTGVKIKSVTLRKEKGNLGAGGPNTEKNVWSYDRVSGDEAKLTESFRNLFSSPSILRPLNLRWEANHVAQTEKMRYAYIFVVNLNRKMGYGEPGRRVKRLQCIINNWHWTQWGYTATPTTCPHGVQRSNSAVPSLIQIRALGTK
jgi:hypothetical protein